VRSSGAPNAALWRGEIDVAIASMFDSPRRLPSAFGQLLRGRRPRDSHRCPTAFRSPDSSKQPVTSTSVRGVPAPAKGGCEPPCSWREQATSPRAVTRRKSAGHIAIRRSSAAALAIRVRVDNGAMALTRPRSDRSNGIDLMRPGQDGCSRSPPGHAGRILDVFPHRSLLPLRDAASYRTAWTGAPSGSQTDHAPDRPFRFCRGSALYRRRVGV
jgi:hypothetical protein